MSAPTLLQPAQPARFVEKCIDGAGKSVERAGTDRYSGPQDIHVEDAMPMELARTPEVAREVLHRKLRSASADDVVRDHLRIVLGPQPYKHNHFGAEEFFAFDARRGAVHDIYGRRLLRTSGNFIRSLSETLIQEMGVEPAGELLYRCGFAWGAADMRDFAERIQQEYEIEFERLGTGVMLESWWWPLRAAGWGVWRYDFRHARNGLILVDLQNSVTAQAQPNAGRPVCHLYAGLFAAAFSHLAGRELAGVELSCAAQGADRCRFLAATAQRAKNAATWRNEGMPVEEIVKRLAANAA